MLTRHDPSTADVAKPPTGLEHLFYEKVQLSGHNPVSKTHCMESVRPAKRSCKSTILSKSGHIGQELFSLELEL